MTRFNAFERVLALVMAAIFVATAPCPVTRPIRTSIVGIAHAAGLRSHEVNADDGPEQVPSHSRVLRKAANANEREWVRALRQAPLLTAPVGTTTALAKPYRPMPGRPTCMHFDGLVTLHTCTLGMTATDGTCYVEKGFRLDPVFGAVPMVAGWDVPTCVRAG